MGCTDVIGYPGGSVIIYCSHQQDIKTNTYFCTNTTEQCVYLKANQTQNTWVHEDRLSVSGFIGGLIVTYRNLSLQDAGSYRYGETGVWKYDVNLKVDSGKKH